MTAAEAQRLQACCQEIAAILNKNTAPSEELILEGENGSVAKIGDGSIQITLVPTSKSF